MMSLLSMVTVDFKRDKFSHTKKIMKTFTDLTPLHFIVTS